MAGIFGRNLFGFLMGGNEQGSPGRSRKNTSNLSPRKAKNEKAKKLPKEDQTSTNVGTIKDNNVKKNGIDKKNDSEKAKILHKEQNGKNVDNKVQRDGLESNKVTNNGKLLHKQEQNEENKTHDINEQAKASKVRLLI